MEITEQEYLQMKEQIKQLELKIEGINRKPHDLASMVRVKPYGFVRNATEDKPVFVFEEKICCDAWKFFIDLAKRVHEPANKFYMDKGLHNEPYIRSFSHGKYPVKISLFTEEQLEISADMLNEMVPIYNKYYAKAHKTVLYANSANGNYREVNISTDMKQEIRNEDEAIQIC